MIIIKWKQTCFASLILLVICLPHCISVQPLLQAGGHGTCITQCRSARITTTKTIPMQVDGEACKLTPSIIEMTLLNKAPMLAKRRGGKANVQYVPSLYIIWSCLSLFLFIIKCIKNLSLFCFFPVRSFFFPIPVNSSIFNS